MVCILDDRFVFKEFFLGDKAKLGEIEREAYRLLAERPSPHVVKCYDPNQARGVILERLECDLDQHLKDSDQPTTKDEHLLWAEQAARGVAHLHKLKIIHSDLNIRNMLLDRDGNLKLCDFSGSSINGQPRLVSVSAAYKLPNDDPDVANRQSDIFALGTAFFEMAVGHSPYHGKTDPEITELYRDGQFCNDYPLDKDQKFWVIIQNCWYGRYKSVDDIVEALSKM